MSNQNDWKDLDAYRLYKKVKNFLVVKPKNIDDPAPLFCDLCKSTNLMIDDMICHREYGCCSACVLLWVEPRKSEWLNGWRPSETEIEIVLKRRFARKQKFPFILNT